MTTSHHRFLIAGAGPMGLGAAFSLKRLGVEDFLVLEKDQTAGGLASSFLDPQGFVWDIGVHVHYSEIPSYNDIITSVVAGDFWARHLRQSWIWFRERRIPFPFQNHIHQLPFPLNMTCFVSLLRAAIKRKETSPRHFKEWVLSEYGAEVARHFFIPYNLKLWVTPLEEMATEWVGKRVAPVDLVQIMKGFFQKPADSGWGGNRHFLYPQKGGNGQFCNAVAHSIGAGHLRFGEAITNVDLRKKVVTTPTGDYGFDHLISSIPLDELCRQTDGLSEAAQRASRQLRFTSVDVIGIGLKGQPPSWLSEPGWFYFPGAEAPFYRLIVQSNLSPACVPRPGETWSLLLEMARRPGDSREDGDDLRPSLQFLIQKGFVRDEASVVSVWKRRAPHGYPVPHVDRDGALRRIMPELEANHIFSRGRFGTWKYEIGNQDHAFMQGVEISERLVSGKPETVYAEKSLMSESGKTR